MHTVSRIFIGVNILELVAVGVAAQCAANALKRPLSSAAGTEQITIVGVAFRTFADRRIAAGAPQLGQPKGASPDLASSTLESSCVMVFAEILEISAKNVQQKTGDNSHHVFIGFFA